ncbi:MAG: hypothetical protein OIN85_09755 [Candidatus Methanoperedens sp.]|nr:hypothetical protein [Candidatus Methanoperedens sp.]
MVVWKEMLLIARVSEENEPQINADERGFVASNPAHLIGSWDFSIPLVSEFFMCGCIVNVSAHGIL